MELTVRIEKADLKDLPLLLEWRMRVLREVFSLPETEDLSALFDGNKRYYERHLKSGSHTACFVFLEDTDTIIGCGGICYQEELPSPDNESGTCGYLMNIYTLPEYRKKGVGERIVQFLIEDARKRGTGKIYLESSKDGWELYHRLGFREVEGYLKLTELS